MSSTKLSKPEEICNPFVKDIAQKTRRVFDLLCSNTYWWLNSQDFFDLPSEGFSGLIEHWPQVSIRQGRWSPGPGTMMMYPELHQDSQRVDLTYVLPFVDGDHSTILDNLANPKLVNSYVSWELSLHFSGMNPVLEKWEYMYVAGPYRQWEGCEYVNKCRRQIARSHSKAEFIKLDPLLLSEIFMTARESLIYHRIFKQVKDAAIYSEISGVLA